MRIDYLDGGVRITDLTLTAALLSKMGNLVSLVGTEPVNNGRGQLYFVLAGDIETLREHIAQFLKGSLSIQDAKDFGGRIRDLKALVYVMNNEKHK